MLAHSRLIAPSGGREIIDTGPSANVTFPRPLVSWEAEGKEPQELELFVYPIFYGDPSVDAGFATWENVYLQLDLAGGGAGESNAALFSTLEPWPDRVGRSNFSLPNNGTRLRFCARQARLAIQHIAYGDTRLTLYASFSPCRGLTPGSSVPDMIGMGAGNSPANEPVRVVPKGAREVRCVHATDSMGSILFFPPYTPPALPDAAQAIPVVELAEWHGFTGHAWAVGFQPSHEFLYNDEYLDLQFR